MAAAHSEAWLRQQCSVGSASQNRAQKPAANGCGACRKEVRRTLRLGVVILGFIDFASIYFNGLLAILFVLLFRVWCLSASSTFPVFRNAGSWSSLAA